MFSVIPATFALIKAWAIWAYPLNAEKMQEIEQVLAERKSTRSDDA
jgi:Na+/melibiose symporter-like transporter